MFHWPKKPQYQSDHCAPPPLFRRDCAPSMAVVMHSWTWGLQTCLGDGSFIVNHSLWCGWTGGGSSASLSNVLHATQILPIISQHSVWKMEIIMKHHCILDKIKFSTTVKQKSEYTWTQQSDCYVGIYSIWPAASLIRSFSNKSSFWFEADGCGACTWLWQTSPRL